MDSLQKFKKAGIGSIKILNMIPENYSLSDVLLTGN